MDRDTLIANPGMVYTDGTTYGKIIHLSKSTDKSRYHMISEAEYKKILKELERKAMNEYGV